MRGRIVKLIAMALVALLIIWIARHTYWDEVTMPLPPKGEAARNPFYASQRFLEALGARTAWDRMLTALPADAVLVVSSWSWSLSPGRRERLEHWVEAGGRLVVDRTSLGEGGYFEAWSGIGRELLQRKDENGRNVPPKFENCHDLRPGWTRIPSGSEARYAVCGLDPFNVLTSRESPEWILRDDSGIQVVRVKIGRGSVTAINAIPFRYRMLFQGDHGALLAAATQMRRGDSIHFLSEEDHPSLLALLWRYGSPVVLLALALITLLLWRGGVRFGPLAAQPDTARRSLSEQILGTGRFALRFGGGAGLHAAALRALNEAAAKRIPAYPQLSSAEKVAALARLSGIDAQQLATAVNFSGPRRAPELRETLLLLETARRKILISNRRLRYANGIQYDHAGS